MREISKTAVTAEENPKFNFSLVHRNFGDLICGEGVSFSTRKQPEIPNFIFCLKLVVSIVYSYCIAGFW